MVHILLRSKDRYSFGVSIHFSFFKCIFYVDLWSDIIANKCMLVKTSQLKKLYWFSVLPMRVWVRVYPHKFVRFNLLEVKFRNIINLIVKQGDTLANNVCTLLLWANHVRKIDKIPSQCWIKLFRVKFIKLQ